METIEGRQLKDVELEILKYVHNVCEENKLKYYLTYGTLIGAVRHKGFIPWDDDIDIIMPREDYYKLMKILDEQKGDYAFLSCHNDKSFFYPLAKVVDTRTALIQHGTMSTHDKLGVYIDIFILDNLPDDPKKQLRLMKRVKLAEKIWYMCIRKPLFRRERILKDLVRAAVCLPFKLIPKHAAVMRLDRIAAEYSKEITKEKIVLCFAAYNDGTRMFTGEYEDIIDIEFEGQMFKTVGNYHKTLTQTYGEYMELPPESERQGVHDFTAYWRKNVK